VRDVNERPDEDVKVSFETFSMCGMFIGTQRNIIYNL
jgi:hypothetical protein